MRGAIVDQIDAEDLFEIDEINLEITRCELELLLSKRSSFHLANTTIANRKSNGQRLNSAAKKKPKWTASKARVYRKPHERATDENYLNRVKGLFPEPSLSQKKKKTKETVVVEDEEDFVRDEEAVRDGTNAQVSNRHARDKIEERVSREYAKTYTFEPKINRDSTDDDTDDVGRRRERRKRLMRSRMEIVLEREEAKRMADKAAFEAECTFRPHILEYKKKKNETNKNGTTDDGEENDERASLPVTERLYEEAKKREERLKELREREQKKMEEALRETRATTSSVEKQQQQQQQQQPIHERLHEIAEKRELYLQEVIKKVDEQFRETHTFKPKKMRSTSEKLAALAQRRLKDIIALTGKENEDAKVKNKATRDFKEIQQQQKPFKITAKSEKIMQKNIKRGKIGEGFLERQYEFASKIRAKRENESLTNEEVLQSKCTFSPDIHISELRHCRTHFYETQDERSKRLAITEAQNMNERVDIQRKERDEQFTFAPKINERSNIIGNKTNLDELASSKSRDLEREAAKQIYELENLKECTFSPHVSTLSKAKDADFIIAVSKKSGSYGKHDSETITSRTKNEKEMREFNLEQARREQDFEEQKTCTFSPQIIEEPPNYLLKNVPAEDIVRGLSKYYDNVEKATKMKVEQENRRQKAFLENVSHIDVRHKITKPKEFTFARNQTERLKEKSEKLLNEKLRREMKECTFQPQINDYYYVVKSTVS